MGEPTENMSIWNEDGDKSVDVVNDGTNNRLATDTLITGNISVPNPRPGTYFSRHAKNGAVYEMNVNGSVTPVYYTLAPAAGKKMYVYRVMIGMEDSSMNFTKFGGISGGITNGIEILVKEGGAAEYNILENNWKKNADLKKTMYDANIESAATDILGARWTFSKGGTILELSAARGDYIKIKIQDNLTPLNSFIMVFQGHEVDL